MQHELVEALTQPGLDVELLERLRLPERTRRAACAGSRLNFVPSQSASAQWAEVPPELAAICGRCEARDECLAMALADSSLTGCWGGLSDRQQAELRRAGRAV